VAGLGHREAAEQVGRDDVAEVGVVVLLAAERHHRAAEQPPLHAGLDHQRQVELRQHLGGDDRAAGIGAAPVRDGEARLHARIDRQLPDEPGDPLPALLERLARHRHEPRPGELLARRLPHVRPPAVERLLKPKVTHE
jgi:hypothetical protein